MTTSNSTTEAEADTAIPAEDTAEEEAATRADGRLVMGDELLRN